MKKDLVILASASVGSALIGATTTYFILNHKLSTKYQEIADAEIESVKEVYAMTKEVKERNEMRAEDEAIRRANDEAEFLPSEEKVEVNEVVEKLVALGYGEGTNTGHRISYQKMADNPPMAQMLRTPEPSAHYVVEGDKVTDTSTGNLFDIPYEETLSDDVMSWPRSSERPFIITNQEFFEDDDEEDYGKITITYWEADDTLADEREQLIPNIAEVVGHNNLKHFGKGSDDPNIVYVRNDKIKVDYEVVKDPRSYSTVVLGINEWDARDQKDTGPKIKKMRGDD